MLDLIGWLLTINENANLREELRLARGRKTPKATLSLTQKVLSLEAENEDLKIRLGVLIRTLVQKKLIDLGEYAELCKKLKLDLRKI